DPDFLDGSMMSLYLIPRRLLRRVILNVDRPQVLWDDLEEFTDDFEAFEIHVYARSDDVGVADDAQIAVNADLVAANYDRQYFDGAGGAASAARSAGELPTINIPGAAEGADEYGGGTVQIPLYARTDGHKHFIHLMGRQENNVRVQSGRWENNNAITRIAITPVSGTNFVADSVFELWGIVPLATTIRREQDNLAAGRDPLISTQALRRPFGRAWRE
ncbi:hypothetical protein LCGC14_1990420, partial [marine sediment metagenome]